MDDCHCPDKIGVCPSICQTTNNPEAVSFGGSVTIDDVHGLLGLVCDLVSFFVAFGKA